MARIDVEMAIEKLTLGEKVALTAGMFASSILLEPTLTSSRTQLLADGPDPPPQHPLPSHIRWAQLRSHSVLQWHPRRLFTLRQYFGCYLGY